MPPLPISLTIQAAVPWLSATGKSVISLLVAANGQIRNAETLAARLRIRSRFRLARLLRREGLPPVGQLSDWICVLQIVWEAEASQRSLYRFARHAGMEPATCYRRCVRVLGVGWREIRSRGFAWALVRFLDQCRRPIVRTHKTRQLRSGALQTRHLTSTADLFARPGDPARSGRIKRKRSGAAAVGPRFPLRNLQRVPLGHAPTDAAVSASGAVYVSRAFAAVVERLDPLKMRSVCSIPVGFNPTRIVVDATGQHAYVSNQFGSSISVIDTTADRVIDEVMVSGDPAPLIVAADRHTLYVTTNLDRLYAIDLRTKHVIAETLLPAASHHLALHPDRQSLLVSTRTAGIVLELDAVDLSFVRSVQVGGLAQELVLETNSGELYVANEQGWLDVVSLHSFTLTASLRLEAGAYGLALSPDSGRLLATLPSIGRVVVVDRTTLRLIQTIETGGMPRHTVFDRSGQVAFVVNEAGWLDVLG